ncbi:hypothetical protein KY361_06245 [Candidatus Woesearchaeota archaeon]|nr:hypothetical protein [Candidatus Woesearchaeota archaeon]
MKQEREQKPEYSAATQRTLERLAAGVEKVYHDLVEAGLPDTKRNKVLVYRELYCCAGQLYSLGNEDGRSLGSKIVGEDGAFAVISETGNADRSTELPDAISDAGDEKIREIVSACKGCMYLLLEQMIEATGRKDKDRVMELNGHFDKILLSRYGVNLSPEMTKYDHCAGSCATSLGFLADDYDTMLADARKTFAELSNPWLE